MESLGNIISVKEEPNDFWSETEDDHIFDSTDSCEIKNIKTFNFYPASEEKSTINTENRTISRVEFEPGVDDDGKSVTCRAENPNVTGLFLETSWRIDVVYAPIVSLRLGSTLNAEDIKEGDDVYFECQIKANPPWSKLTWIHNGVVLTHNTSARIIWSNQSLVLQSVTRNSAGLYVCAATNSIQETKSEPLEFRVKYAPVCKEDRIVVVGASRGESLKIACRVEADPPILSFRWKFNNSGETLEVSTKRFSVEPSKGLSVLTYVPNTELDYGTLSCWAENVVGIQAKPCLFQLVAAGKPFPVRNCSLANQTYTSVEVKCYPGYDGGLPQEFVLEVYHGDLDSLVRLRPLYNVTAKNEPFFVLSGLQASVDAGVHVAVYAVNAKGRSESVVLGEVTFRDAEKRTGQDAGMSLSPLLGVLIGALITLGSIVLALIVRARRERVTADSSDKSAACMTASGSSSQATMRHEKSAAAAAAAAELSDFPSHHLHQHNQYQLQHSHQYHNSNNQQYQLQNQLEIQLQQQTVETDPDVIPTNKFEGNLMEVSPPSYPGSIGGNESGYSLVGQWVTPGPTPSIDELCHKFQGRPTELRLPSRSASGSLMGGGAITTTTTSTTSSHHHQLIMQKLQAAPNATSLTNVSNSAGGPCVVVAGECLDGEAIKRRLMANRLPESCV
uniref:Ig-like domain-containing protein n=1 Tax=Trichogramma kaykai TaxID=54128 RepID=A0ABD2XEZ8_9HYME